LDPTPAPTGGRRWRSLFPPAQWLAGYQASWLAPDLVAGMTLAAYAIPVALAYATLAGLPPEFGVYCYLVAGPAYALFGSSRQLAIGPTSAISLLVGTTIATMAAGDLARWEAIAALTAMIVAAVSLLAWLFRLSFVISFVGETILLGFKAGAALTIALTQLPKLFGVPGGGDGFFNRLWTLGTQLGDTKLIVLAFGLAAIGLLLAGEKLLPGRPIALVVVALSIVALSVTPLAQAGFKTVGLLPSGLPAFALPSLRPSDVDGVIPLALACFLLAYIEGVSAARALAARHGYEIDPRQELLALGAANLAASLGQAYPVAGGLSQSTVNDKAGARTPLALVFASVAIGLCLVYLTGLLANLPDVVLAAIVLVAVKGLIDIPGLRRVRQLDRLEFWVAMAAFVGVLMLGILKGVLLAAIVSMLLVIARAARPHVARLGCIPGTDRYSDLERHADNQTIPGVLIVRVESAILYFNTDHVRARVRTYIAAAGPDLKLVVWDLSSSPYVDIAGGELLAEIHKELEARGVNMRLVDPLATVRDLLRAEVGPALGDVTRRLSINDAIRSAGLSPKDQPGAG
jgi:high affinity sulfate transporter 1